VHTALKQFRFGLDPEGDLRCDCGKLLARVLHTVLELKCPRCKRVVLVVDGHRYQPAGAKPACTCADGPPESLPHSSDT
jgi:hypothetical protein